MVEKIEGIVTDIIRHTDKHNVVTLYTLQRGRMAFLSPVGKSKTGKMRNAIISLMAVVSADINVTAGRDLYTLRQPNPIRLWHGIYSNPLKSSQLFFITEFCNKLIRQYPPDSNLWHFIVSSLETLDNLPLNKTSNFHVAFLTGLLQIVGIRPSVDGWERGQLFDMLSGEMMGAYDNNFLQRKILLNEEESRFLPLLLRINFKNMWRYKLTNEERNRITDRLLAYYSYHLPISEEMKSLPVLREIFS